MMKKYFSFFVVLLIAVTTWAQNPKLSYQAVVRDNTNRLVSNERIQLDISVLKTDGNVQYNQHFDNVLTNQNGLVSLLYGGLAGWDSVNWTDARLRVAVTLPDLSVVIDTSAVYAVPMSLSSIHIETVDSSLIPQSDWNETNEDTLSYIVNKPDILDSIARYLEENEYLTESNIDNRHYLRSDSLLILQMQNDIQNHTNTLEELNNSLDEYAKLAESNLFTANNDFTAGITRVPNGYVVNVTNADNCTQDAVNACDLYSVQQWADHKIDSLKLKYDTVKSNLESMLQTPIFVSTGCTPHTTTLEVNARVFSKSSPVIRREFCYSETNDIATAICLFSGENSLTIEGVSPYTKYYIWAKATNVEGTAVSEVIEARTYPEKALISNYTLVPSDGEIAVSADIDFRGTPTAQLVLGYVKAGSSDTVFLATKTISNNAFKDTIHNVLNSTEYVVVIKVDNGAENGIAVAQEHTTTPVGAMLTVSSDALDTVTVCQTGTSIHYTATIENVEDLDAYTYQWSVNGVDSTAQIGNVLTVNYPSVNSRCKVECVAVKNNGRRLEMSNTMTTITEKQTIIPTIVICSNCDEGRVYVKSISFADSASWKLDGMEKYKYSSVGSYPIEPGAYSVELFDEYGCVSTYPVKIESLQTSCEAHRYNDYENGENDRLTTVRDRNHYHNYKVVQIGDQCWLRENLRKDNSDEAKKYGSLYSWNEAVTSCPVGWHLPSDAEWDMLERAALALDANHPVAAPEIGSGLGQTVASNTELAAILAGGCDWDGFGNGKTPNSYSDSLRNKSGFSAVPAGTSFGFQSVNAYFWTSDTEPFDGPSRNNVNSRYCHYRALRSSLAGVECQWNAAIKYYYYVLSSQYYFSVRCVRDAEN